MVLKMQSQEGALSTSRPVPQTNKQTNTQGDPKPLITEIRVRFLRMVVGWGKRLGHAAAVKVQLGRTWAGLGELCGDAGNRSRWEDCRGLPCLGILAIGLAPYRAVRRLKGGVRASLMLGGGGIPTTVQMALRGQIQAQWDRGLWGHAMFHPGGATKVCLERVQGVGTVLRAGGWG